MPSTTSYLAAAAAFLPAAFAHYNFEALIVNGNVTSPYEYVRQTNNSNSPITDITSTNMICNSGGLCKYLSGAICVMFVTNTRNLYSGLHPCPDLDIHGRSW